MHLMAASLYRLLHQMFHQNMQNRWNKPESVFHVDDVLGDLDDVLPYQGIYFQIDVKIDKLTKACFLEHRKAIRAFADGKRKDRKNVLRIVRSSRILREIIYRVCAWVYWRSP